MCPEDGHLGITVLQKHPSSYVILYFDTDNSKFEQKFMGVENSENRRRLYGRSYKQISFKTTPDTPRFCDRDVEGIPGTALDKNT